MEAPSVLMPEWTRPIRIPKTIPLTHADPPVAWAGALGEWRLPFRLARDVPAGSQLKLQIWGGRNNRGGFSVQTDHPAGEGYLTVTLAGGRRLAPQREKESGTFLIPLPQAGLRKGQRLTAILGDRSGGGPGSRATTLRLLNKMAVLYHIPPQRPVPDMPQWTGGSVWAKGTEDLLLAVCTFHVLGGPLHRLRAYGPASARPGESFRLLVRPEDEWGNLASEAPGDLAVLLDGQSVPAAFAAVPGSVCRQANVALAREGVARLRVRESGSGRETVTPPILCSPSAMPAYWGMIHGHTEMSDGTGTLDQYFHQLRNEVRLDFAATGDHDHLWETPDAFWSLSGRAVKRWHEPGVFVTFPGYEWAKWRRNGDGDRNVYYLRDGRPMYRSDEGHYPSPPDLFRALRDNRERAIVIPHHTGHEGNFCDWKDHDPAFERLVEIYQVRGSYECAEADGNPAPERDSRHPPHAEGFVQRALALGWRIGFTGGGDDHEGSWGTERVADPEVGYKQGAMSVEAGALTRKALFQALYERRTVATTGARLLVSYTLNGQPMGAECRLGLDPGLATKRDLAVSVHGTAPLARVDILRNNRVVHTVPGRDRLDLEFIWSDTQPLSEIWLPAAKHCDHPFSFYYIRVVQADREAAWASPIWIDP
jgi:hypothetical protein